EQWISYFFVWHVFLKVVFQLPITRWVKSINYVSILLVAVTVWSLAFFLLWLTAVVPSGAVYVVVGAFSLIALAEILYSPAGVSLLGEMSPENLRGIYFSLESQCWSIGFAVGPAVGGWALDHPDTVGINLWLYIITGGLIASLILAVLRQQLAAESTLAIES
ncbi:MAG: MFS transporter, partial [Cyanobacteria bacterium J06642_11]